MAELTVPTINFSALGDLPAIWKQGQQDQARRLALADLGKGGNADYSKAIGSLAALGDLEGAAKVATIQKATAPPETAAAIQEFKFAQANGYRGGLLDYLKEKAAAGATRVNTTVQSGEKEFDKAVGKDYGETFVGMQKAGRDAGGAINNLNIMENMTRDPNFYSGTGGEIVTRLKQAGVSTGFLPEGAASANEVFQKVSQKAVIDNLGSLGTGVSNEDRRFIQGTVPNITNSPEGNRQIIGMGRKIEQRKQEVAKLAREYASKRGGRIDAGFDDYLADWSEKNPLFPGGSIPGRAGNRTKSGVSWSVE
ncbi:MAG: hypothetical protein E6Q98_20840 [Rhodospirillaceae bacterium]|nr:MAG: hypothetical protein E6Q98_20840 [Rhodospirillaceae bacterium]